MEGSTPRIMSKKQSGMTASQSSITNAISQIGLNPPGSITPNITSREREERGRLLREKQNEDRAKKLEELKQQAIAAQKYREQKEIERRQRIEDMRSKDSERRNQVEERKRVLWEAEQEKRDAILRKAQEREARLQAKRRNERSSLVFAFGSSTPRMLDPVTSTSFWGRRAASTINVGCYNAPLTRRMSERELNFDSNSKKQRATSAHVLHRKPDDSDADKTDAGERQTFDHLPLTSFTPNVRKMKTDLTPTLTSPARETGRSFFLRSAGTTPSVSRPQSAISNVGEDKHPSVIHRPRSSVKPRPNSIAVSGINLSIAVSKELKNIDGIGPESKNLASSSRSSSSSSTPMKSSTKSNPPPSRSEAKTVPTTPSEQKKPPIKPTKPTQKTNTVPSAKTSTGPAVAPEVLSDAPVGSSDVPVTLPDDPVVLTDTPMEPVEEVQSIKNFPEADQQQQQEEQNEPPPEPATPVAAPAEVENGKEELPECDMTSSFTSKKIASEEEAKAALTERRRQIREQQEREAQLAKEMKARQLEKEAEEKQKRLEEAKARREEYNRQEELRRQEEQRRKDEEERFLKEQAEREAEAQRKEEEQRQALEREQEKKAQEEAERQRQEIAERLRKEEEEREERRKRVAMIMSRTRKGEKNAPVISNKDGAEETEGRVSPSDNVESAKSISNNRDVMDKSVCQPASDIIMGDVMLVNSIPQETNGHKNE
ncbi:ensconsin-like isoform X1 [Neocloeon triangulifer]|uniref:ensconsin-like isoform X1 n=1 Tax=Neocloeon triangulifer TaxID=2078957 RepID=UPI00286F954A|nr:ensconsin-like isoform X1 [Neocloeon triangulifer]XP_059485679.1 ensconsin-like isoform X1 [Neocloeon triangulifer]XP_059485680.1 ensconsin-like isoform X1 [Neocloeon triangulifer]